MDPSNNSSLKEIDEEWDNIITLEEDIQEDLEEDVNLEELNE